MALDNLMIGYRIPTPDFLKLLDITPNRNPYEEWEDKFGDSIYGSLDVDNDFTYFYIGRFIDQPHYDIRLRHLKHDLALLEEFGEEYHLDSKNSGVCWYVSEWR